MNTESDTPTPRALQAPNDAVVVIDAGLAKEPIQMSRTSERRRMILPLHKNSRDPLQRMLNVLQPGSYVQPHRHISPPKAESIIVLRGSIGCVTFNDDGTTDRVLVAAAGSETYGIDIEAGIYHTFFALQEDTVLFEVKTGPFDPSSDKGFAPWAPVEGSEGAGEYLKMLQERVTSR